jgi:DNA-binding LacI/PurR family transcriptional regulator
MKALKIVLRTVIMFYNSKSVAWFIMDIFENIQIDAGLETTLVSQIKQQVIWLIASNMLNPGDRLPSIRQFARHFFINMNTVRAAYLQLEGEGWVETRQGLGTRVLTIQPGNITRREEASYSHTIGVILPSINNPFYHMLLEGLETSLPSAHPLLFVCSTHDDPSLVGRYYAQLATRNVDGIILASHALPGEIQATPALPLVHLDWPESRGYSVLLDVENAGKLAANHLIGHGYQRIALISNSHDLPNVSPIVNGFRRALLEGNLELKPELMVKVDGFDMENGALGAENLMGCSPPPDAIFAITDALAIGAMNYLKIKGLKIPGDLGMMGFNDIPLARLVEPSLTTVSAPAYQMGVEAMQVLQKLIQKTKPPQKQILLETRLVIRQSCGAH